ncbi:uncharacterized protein LOC26527494 [Drosophila mojavensis]|uniref:Uncharacterized protein n=1 Tax=Drosophila mojavensis TaxID=7230 RepID=A0A0Q9XHS3_DROMO|nr:uncharacterized protein LOC26527494 [Drosophila mojavensis]KRG03075.1 uncharacterized protein Dmoj_GI25853 [Drosophila mojavensis]
MERPLYYFVGLCLLFSTVLIVDSAPPSGRTLPPEYASETSIVTATLLPQTTKPPIVTPISPPQTSKPPAETSKAPPQATTLSMQTTTNKNNIENEKINLKIAHILEISKIGHIVGNAEYDQETAHLRHIASLGPESLQLKLQAYDKFVSYNYLRLKLESNLLSRIAVVESYLIHKPLSKKCKKVYRKQRKELTAALNEQNLLKSYKLNLYSRPCRSDSWEGSQQEDYFDWLDWLQWFHFF